jgi:hypothetical protein
MAFLAAPHDLAWDVPMGKVRGLHLQHCNGFGVA